MSVQTTGSCHCGAVSIKVPEPPGTVTDCHCSICRRYGALWAYYPHETLVIEGPTAEYVRKDGGVIGFHFCGTCGCMVAWRRRVDRIPHTGVNARLLDGFDSRTADIFSEDDGSE